MKTKLSLLIISLLVILMLVAAPALAQQGKDFVGWIIAKQLTVQGGGAEFQSNVTMTGDLAVTDDIAADDIGANDITASGGVTATGNISATDITATDDLVVTDGVTYGAGSLHPIGNTTAGLIYNGGSTGVITGSVAYTASTTGLATSITSAGCALGQAPSAAAGGPYKCHVIVSGTSLTVTLTASDTTVATAGGSAFWWALGQ